MRRMYQIQNIVSHIVSNYNKEICAIEIEKISNYSYRNVERLFSSIFDESIKSFQRRLRLENAYKQIIYSSQSITDIAINVGYANLQSFSKAFKKQFRIAPVQARLDKNLVFEDFIKNSLSKLDIEKLYKNTETIYYKAIKSNNYNNNQINSIWREIEQKNVQAIPYESFGIIENQPLITEHKNCIYGFALNKISKNNNLLFTKKEIFGGYYLKFTHFGDYDYIEETYKKFYKYWLNSNFELGETNVIEHYIVSEKELSQPKDFITHIYFPLK